MPALTFFNHLLNFLAPAFFLALWLALGARLVWRKATPVLTLWEQILIQTVLGGCVLGACLALSGRDGLLGSYALLVLLAASCQWLMSRGWRTPAG